MTINTSNIIKGIIAGLIGTIVLTVLMMIKKKIGLMPELDPVHMVSDTVALKLGMEPNIVIGWVLHFGIGAVWGGGFAVLNNILPGSSQIAKGIVMGIGAWLLMMIGLMPISGSGLFGMNMGIMAPVITLVLHLVFGAALGAVFGKLTQGDPA